MSHTAGKRAAVKETSSTRISPTLALAIAAPLLTGLALVVQAPADSQRVTPDRDPATEPLTAQSLACPAPISGGGSLVVASGADEEATGEVSLRAAGGSGSTRVGLRPGAYAEVSAPAAPVIITASEGLAPGLFGGRFGAATAPAVGECVAPIGERWFVGVGAGGDHTSKLQLVNPDVGPAVADVSLWSTDGPLEEVESRGLTIAGGSSTQLDLEKLAPHRHDLAMRVSVSRGRLAATVADAYTFTGTHATRDWMPTTAAPATSLLLPGLARKADERTLVLVNPGEDEGRVTLQVVGARSTFAPTRLEEIRVPAGRVVTADLTDSLARALAKEDGSLLVTSTVPVAAGMHSVVNDDLVHNVALPPTAGTSAALVPSRGDNVLMVSASGSSGRFTVTFLGPRNRQRAAAVQAGTTRTLAIPSGTVAVLVSSTVTYSAAVRTVRDAGASLSPLRPLVLDQLIPAVRPAWPPQSAR
jgi:hypothetical protein